ncbi:MAG: AsmA family protein [Geminicoccaceae bacterium]
MKKFLLVLLGVIVLVIAAAVVVPFLLPTDTYKQQIEAQVERVTGRKLAIAGPLDISLLPTAAVTAEDVRFANVEGGTAPDMMSLKGLQAELKIWPLLRGVVEVDRFVLIEPAFHLEIDADGRPNWALGAPRDEAVAAETPQDETASEEQAPPEAGGGMRLPVSEVKLGDIRVENGSLTFTDARSGAQERIEAINLDLDLPDLRSPLQADGSLAYKGETVNLALAVERPLELIEGGSSPVRVNGEAPDLTLTFDGAVANATPPSATGAVELNVSSIRDLAAWLAEPIAFEGEGLRTLRIAGKLAGSPTRVTFDDATVAIDAIEGQGNVAVDLSGAVPRLTGRLDLGAVDLNPYLPPETGAETSDRGPAGQGGQAGGGADGGDWSDEPIELPPIGGAEVDFELTVDALRVRDLQLDRSVVALRLDGARMRADFKEIALYGGRGSGQLDVRVVEGTPRISEEFRLEGLQALPFLRDAADFERLAGTASAEVSLKTRGRSQRELVQNLDGEGRATFVDGAIVGINLAGMLRNVATAFQGGGGDRRTDFAELSGTFRIRNGILTNDDLWLQAPVMRVAGSGQLDLPRRTVDYRVEPRAATTLKGQGGERDVAGLLVPVIVRGPWDDLSFTPDVGDLARRALENPEAVREQIEQLGDVGKAIKKGGAEKVLEGLLGGGGEGGDSQGGDPAQKLLKGLFGN